MVNTCVEKRFQTVLVALTIFCSCGNYLNAMDNKDLENQEEKQVLEKNFDLGEIINTLYNNNDEKSDDKVPCIEFTSATPRINMENNSLITFNSSALFTIEVVNQEKKVDVEVKKLDKSSFGFKTIFKRNSNHNCKSPHSKSPCLSPKVDLPKITNFMKTIKKSNIFSEKSSKTDKELQSPRQKNIKKTIKKLQEDPDKDLATTALKINLKRGMSWHGDKHSSKFISLKKIGSFKVLKDDEDDVNNKENLGNE